MDYKRVLLDINDRIEDLKKAIKRESDVGKQEYLRGLLRLNEMVFIEVRKIHAKREIWENCKNPSYH